MATTKNNTSIDSFSETAVSDLYGLKVYTANGVYIGTVDDVRVNFREQKVNGLALKDVSPTVRNKTKEQTEPVVIPYGWVESVHDIIITIDVVDRLKTEH